MNVESKGWVGPFLGRLKSISNPDNPDRGTLAQLRRGLGGDPTDILLRIGWVFAGIPDNRGGQLDKAILFAGLYSLGWNKIPQEKDLSLGRAMADFANSQQSDGTSKRFVGLVATSSEDLPHKLRQVITLISPKVSGLDWERLLRELMQWDHPDRFVQRNWAGDFWNNLKKNQDSSDYETLESGSLKEKEIA